MRLVIADAHIGRGDSGDLQELFELLDSENWEEVIILGDFLDLWGELNPEELSRSFCKLSLLPCPVMYVLGNHDSYLISIVRDSTLNITLTNFYEQSISGRRFLFLHGHQSDPFMRYQRLVKAVIKIYSLCHRLLHFDLQRCLRRTLLGKKYLISRREAVISTYYGEADVLVFGHFHDPDHSKYFFREYVSLGDWSSHRSYAVIDDKGQIQLRTKR